MSKREAGFLLLGGALIVLAAGLSGCARLYRILPTVVPCSVDPTQAVCKPPTPAPSPTPTPSPTPAPNPAPTPAPDGELLICNPPTLAPNQSDGVGGSAFLADLFAAEAALDGKTDPRTKNPWYEADAPRRLNSWPLEGAKQLAAFQAWAAGAADVLNRVGFCASPDGDNLVVCRWDRCSVFHPVEFKFGRVLTSGGYSGTFFVAVPVPAPTPSPIPTPKPIPAPTPSPSSTGGCPLLMNTGVYFVVDLHQQTTAYGYATNATFWYCREPGTGAWPPEGYIGGKVLGKCLQLGVDAVVPGHDDALRCETTLIGHPRWYKKPSDGPRAPWEYVKEPDGTIVNPFIGEIDPANLAYACPRRDLAPVWRGPGQTALLDCSE